MNKQVKIWELYDSIPMLLRPLFEKYTYPWEVLPHIKTYLYEIIKSSPHGYREYSKGILVGEDVKIHYSANIVAPCIIGDGTEIRYGAYIRGSVYTGKGCVIGNSTEIKNSILFDSVQAPHYNYIGDSVLGTGTHTGAGVILSNLKSDKTDVSVHGDTVINTKLRKAGAFLGDGADIGCNSVLNPGTVVGKNTRAYPLSFMRGVYPAGCIVKNHQSQTVEILN